MNRTASGTITAVIQVLTFFYLEDSSIYFCICMSIIVIESEWGDKSNGTYSWCSQKGVREAEDFQNRVRQAKSLGTYALNYN